MHHSRNIRYADLLPVALVLGEPSVLVEGFHGVEWWNDRLGACVRAEYDRPEGFRSSDASRVSKIKT